MSVTAAIALRNSVATNSDASGEAARTNSSVSVSSGATLIGSNVLVDNESVLIGLADISPSRVPVIHGGYRDPDMQRQLHHERQQRVESAVAAQRAQKPADRHDNRPTR